MARARPGGPTGLRIDWLDLVVAIELFILALIYSRTYTFFPAFKSPLNWLAILIPLAFVVPAIFMRPYAAIVTGAVAVILLAYQLWFASLWGTAFTASALGTYQGLLLAAMIAVHARNRGPSRFLAIFFIAALCYLALYFLLYATIDAKAIMLQQMQGEGDFASAIRRTHDSRGGPLSQNEYKIGTSGVIMTFMVLYSLALAVSTRNIGVRVVAGVLLAITTYGLVISDSRFNFLATVIAAILVLIPISGKWRSYLSLWVAGLGIVGYSISAFANVNLFSLINFDFSGQARVDQFEVANPVFLITPILGIGLKNEGEDFKAVFKGDVFVTDLGWYGDLLQSGVIGMLLLFICYYLIVRLIQRLPRTRENALSSLVLSSMLAYLVCVQFLTPQLWSGAGSIILSIAFAYVGKQRLAEAQPLAGDPAA